MPSLYWGLDNENSTGTWATGAIFRYFRTITWVPSPGRWLSRCEPRSLTQSCGERFPACLTSVPFPAPSPSRDPLCCGLLSAHPALPHWAALDHNLQSIQQVGISFQDEVKRISPLAIPWPAFQPRLLFPNLLLGFVMHCHIHTGLLPILSVFLPLQFSSGIFQGPWEEVPHFLTRSDPSIVGSSRLSPITLVSVAALCLFTVFDSCRSWWHWKLQEGRSQSLFPLECPWHLTKGLVPHCCFRNALHESVMKGLSFHAGRYKISQRWTEAHFAVTAPPHS